MSKKNKLNDSIDEPRINDEIEGYSEARLVYYSDDGNKSIVTTIDKARQMAYDAGLDLIEINPKANPPVLKIEDYSKWLYELKKQLKKNRKPASVLKEIQLRTNIAEHDLEVKASKARKFIESGDKVRVVLTMRGRELSRRDESKKCLLEFINILDDIAVCEAVPRDEGNRCSVILKKKK